MSALFPQEPTHTHIHIQINQNQTKIKYNSLLFEGHRLLFLFCFFCFTWCGHLEGPIVYKKWLSRGAATRCGFGIQNKKSRSVSFRRAFYFFFVRACDFYLPPLCEESSSSLSPPPYLLSLIFTWCPAAAASTHWRPEKAYVQNYISQVVKSNVCSACKYSLSSVNNIPEK